MRDDDEGAAISAPPPPPLPGFPNNEAHLPRKRNKYYIAETTAESPSDKMRVHASFPILYMYICMQAGSQPARQVVKMEEGMRLGPSAVSRIRPQITRNRASLSLSLLFLLLLIMIIFPKSFPSRMR